MWHRDALRRDANREAVNEGNLVGERQQIVPAAFLESRLSRWRPSRGATKNDEELRREADEPPRVMARSPAVISAAGGSPCVPRR